MKLDKNLRDKMRGLLPFDENSTEEFISKEYKSIPVEFRPIFFLKPWNQKQKDEISLIAEKLQNGAAAQKMKSNKDLNEMSRTQIVDAKNIYDIGIENFIEVTKDEDNNCISKEIFDKIPQKIQTEIYMCLSSISGLVSSETVGL